MVSATRYNAQYSFKTTRLKTFGSHLVCVLPYQFLDCTFTLSIQGQAVVTLNTSNLKTQGTKQFSFIIFYLLYFFMT